MSRRHMEASVAYTSIVKINPTAIFY
jgi:hypothetical protein